jgi:glycosyltransferase involved in cell wall biosynthesis
MPAYNAVHIREAISSVLEQTVSSFELLIVDDGSTDDTAEIAAGFAERDPRVQVVRQQNGGTAKARNTAIAVSRAPMFALIDSDDRWMPNFLEVMLGIMKARPELDVLSANAINFGNGWDGTPWKQVSGRIVPVSLTRMIEIEDSICIAAIFRRRVVELAGDFDETLRRNEDYDFWLRAAHAGCQCAFYGRPLAWYRRRPDSVSADEQLMLAGILRVLRKAEAFCADRPEELSAIARKLAVFEHRRRLADARTALRKRDCASASRAFVELAENGHPAYSLMARLTRHAPALALWAYAAKCSIAPTLAPFRRRVSRGARSHDSAVVGSGEPFDPLQV